MKPLLKKAVGAALVCLLAGIAGRFFHDQKQSRNQLCRATTIMYAVASTNYYDTLAEWPKSVVDLVSNRANIRFVSTNSLNEFGRLHDITYEPFDQSLGYGTVKCGTLKLRFSCSNLVWITGVP